MPLILASSSPYRRAVLAKAGFQFRCQSPAIDETAQPGEAAAELVKRLAQEKARAVATPYAAALIVGSDQVCECDGIILGKPGTRENAIRQLEFVSGKVAALRTGIALLNTASDRCQTGLDCCEVAYRKLSRGQIEEYVDAEQPFDCCGSLRAEGPGIRLLKRITGNDPNTLVGLPLIMLIDMLENENYPGG